MSPYQVLNSTLTAYPLYDPGFKSDDDLPLVLGQQPKFPRWPTRFSWSYPFLSFQNRLSSFPIIVGALATGFPLVP